LRILVTGGAGFAGRHLLRELVSRGGYDVYATRTEAEESRDAGVTAGSVRWKRMELSSEESVRAVLREVQPDLIYHLAGQASVGGSFADPVGTWDINAAGTLRLVTALAAEGKLKDARPVRLLVISSAEVYGSVPADDQPIREDRELMPTTPYGASKAGAEIAALQMGRSDGLEVIVARSFNHIGPGQDERFFLPGMARQVKRIQREGGARIIRTGNLEIIRDFLDVRDVVNAYILLMEAGEAGAVYNVCSGEGRTLRLMVTRLLELAGDDFEIEVAPERVRLIDIPMLVGDGEALRELGWRPEFPLDRTLEDVLKEAESQA
jgi:GDP-4-dehydro-6-deoxy-D-mannose reductase